MSATDTTNSQNNGPRITGNDNTGIVRYPRRVLTATQELVSDGVQAPRVRRVLTATQALASAGAEFLLAAGDLSIASTRVLASAGIVGTGRLYSATRRLASAGRFRTRQAYSFTRRGIDKIGRVLSPLRRLLPARRVRPGQASASAEVSGGMQKSHEADERTPICAVCHGIADLAFQHCGHLCICEACIDRFEKQQDPKCPICNRSYSHTQRIFYG
jgi:hypothetical protein